MAVFVSSFVGPRFAHLHWLICVPLPDSIGRSGHWSDLVVLGSDPLVFLSQ